MISTTSSTAEAAAGATHSDPMFAAISAETSKLASHLGMDIIVFGDVYGLAHRGDVILDDVNLDEIDHYLTGYLNGKDDVDVPALVDELVKAEQIIQTLTANMSDGQRTKAASSLEVMGFPVRHATRCKERQELIAEVRGALA